MTSLFTALWTGDLWNLTLFWVELCCISVGLLFNFFFNFFELGTSTVFPKNSIWPIGSCFKFETSALTGHLATKDVASRGMSVLASNMKQNCRDYMAVTGCSGFYSLFQQAQFKACLLQNLEALPVPRLKIFSHFAETERIKSMFYSISALNYNGYLFGPPFVLCILTS